MTMLRNGTRLALNKILTEQVENPNQFETYPQPIPAPRRKLLERLPVQPIPPTLPPMKTPLLQRKALETQLHPQPFPSQPKSPIMTTPLGNKIPVPDIVMQREKASMLPAERVAYEADPQKWYEDRDKWRSNRVGQARTNVIFEDVMGFTQDRSPEGELQNFISYALWTMPIPIEQLAGKGFQLLKSSLSPEKRAIVEGVEQTVKNIAQKEIKVPEVLKGQEGFVKIPGEPEIPKGGKIIPKPVTPEVTKRITRTTKQQDIQETAKILSNKLKESGIPEKDIADLLNVYNISAEATETRASLTFEQLRNLADEGITEDNIRKLTREILAKKFGVPSHEVDLVLEGGSRVNPRLDIQQAVVKAREIDNLIKGNLPTHKEIVESLNRRLLAIPKGGKIIPKGGIAPEILSEDKILNDFGKRIASPKTTEEFATQKELWATERATRGSRFAELLEAERAKGTGAEESIKRATDALAGEYKRTPTGLDLPPEFRDAAYAKIIKVIQADVTIPEAMKSYEIAGTRTALDNALMGKPIPDVAGIRGGSAKSRLLKVFNNNPVIKEIIENPKAVQKKILETALPPEKLDPATLDYLRNVKNIPYGVSTLGEKVPPLGLAEKPLGKQATLDLILDLTGKPIGVSSPPAEAITRFKQFTMLPPTERMKVLGILKKVGINVVDAIGIPKSLVFGYDISPIGRQGIFFAFRYPDVWANALKPMFKALGSEEIGMKVDHEIMTNPNVLRVINKMGLDLYGVGKQMSYMKRPESMASLLAEKYIPGVRASNRGFAIFMNKCMTEVGMKTCRIMEKMNCPDEEFKAMGQLINWEAGRGSLGKIPSGVADIANKIMSSPRWLASRFELPTKLLSASKATRQEAASSLVAWLAAESSIKGLAVLGLGGAGKVELDPRSSDAFKLRIGNKRIDNWVGYAQIVRFLAQMVTGQRKTATGEIVPMSRAAILGRFVQSKESPGIGALVTLLSTQGGIGENYVGEKVDFRTLEGIGKFAKDSFMPAGLSEIIDAYVLEGLPSAALSGIGLLGVGVSTYAPSGASSGMTPPMPPSGKSRISGNRKTKLQKR